MLEKCAVCDTAITPEKESGGLCVEHFEAIGEENMYLIEVDASNLPEGGGAIPVGAAINKTGGYHLIDRETVIGKSLAGNDEVPNWLYIDKEQASNVVTHLQQLKKVRDSGVGFASVMPSTDLVH